MSASYALRCFDARAEDVHETADEGQSLVIDVRIPGRYEVDPDDRKLLAAAALHDQPFGFTQADVDLLHEFSGEWMTAHDAVPSGLVLRLRSLAVRIAALLPPEK